MDFQEKSFPILSNIMSDEIIYIFFHENVFNNLNKLKTFNEILKMMMS